VDRRRRNGPDEALLRRAQAAGWDPVAAAYHFGTKDVAWLTGADADAFEVHLRRRSRTDPPPSPYKKTRGRGLSLPTRAYAGEFPSVLLSRRTWRGFGRRALRADQLGTLLYLTFGAQMAGRPQNGGRVLFKTSPSGGACHPIECYVLAVNVNGVPPGLYHYSPRTSRLHLLKRGARPATIERYLAGQEWFTGAGAVVLMTAVLPRLWWRYAHPRAYRAALLEAGHVCQTFCLVATWLGLAPFCTMALEDSLIEQDLGVDGIGEVLLYAAGVGSKPADGRWVQWPGHRPVPKLPRKSRPR
jgi:SagB-type dehydrogenase family enzyme